MIHTEPATAKPMKRHFRFLINPFRSNPESSHSQQWRAESRESRPRICTQYANRPSGLVNHKLRPLLRLVSGLRLARSFFILFLRGHFNPEKGHDRPELRRNIVVDVEDVIGIIFGFCLL